ncbi:MAG: hypothetical protein DYG98_25920 [Haliscomenobacteraceae bacterium CHB4]|nr:hypothetical protein [Haliscomenobacteraceae bacterium CHB4]
MKKVYLPVVTYSGWGNRVCIRQQMYHSPCDSAAVNCKTTTVFTPFFKQFKSTFLMKLSLMSLLAAVLLMAGCAKDAVSTNEDNSTNQGIEFRTENLVAICHQLGNGEYNPIQVSVNAVQAHLAHGDYLPDADGDGYTAVGACTGSMDDCDDSDDSVHPGAEEICDNGIDDDCDGVVDCGDCTFPFFTEASVSNNAPFFAYYDSEVSVCNILGEEFAGVWIFYENNIFPAALAIEFEEGKVVALLTEQSQCIAIVGEGGITEADYEAALATLRAVIADHPETPNICDLIGLRAPEPTNALTKRGDLMAKIEHLKAKIREHRNK